MRSDHFPDDDPMLPATRTVEMTAFERGALYVLVFCGICLFYAWAQSFNV